MGRGSDTTEDRELVNVMSGCKRHGFSPPDTVVRALRSNQAIFGPGTVIPDSARKILQLLLEQVAEL